MSREQKIKVLKDLAAGKIPLDRAIAAMREFQPEYLELGILQEDGTVISGPEVLASEKAWDAHVAKLSKKYKVMAVLISPYQENEHKSEVNS